MIRAATVTHEQDLGIANEIARVRNEHTAMWAIHVSGPTGGTITCEWGYGEASMIARYISVPTSFVVGGSDVRVQVDPNALSGTYTASVAPTTANPTLWPDPT